MLFEQKKIRVVDLRIGKLEQILQQHTDISKLVCVISDIKPNKYIAFLNDSVLIINLEKEEIFRQDFYKIELANNFFFKEVKVISRSAESKEFIVGSEEYQFLKSKIGKNFQETFWFKSNFVLFILWIFLPLGYISGSFKRGPNKDAWGWFLLFFAVLIQINRSTPWSTLQEFSGFARLVSVNLITIAIFPEIVRVHSKNSLKDFPTRIFSLVIGASLVLILFIMNSTGNNQPNFRGAQVEKVLPRYDVIDLLDESPVRAVINLRVYELLEETQLKQIAMYFRNQYSYPKYERLFILYYQPGMILGEGAWATSHFEPELNVQIQGMKNEDVKKADIILTTLNELTKDHQIIGTWLDDRPPILYYKRFSKGLDGKYYEAQVFPRDLSKSLNIIEKQGNKFGRERAEFRDYSVIEEDGSLGLYGEFGKFATLKKVF